MKTQNTLAALVITTLSLSAHADLARVGPVDAPSPAGHGFPKWYQDLNGMVLDLCLPDASDPGAGQQNACLLVGPGLPDPPYSFPTNFPEEAFYFNATALMDLPGGKRVTLVTAVEAAFNVGPVIVGDQITFTRLRVFAGVPEPGIYTVTHPYGVETFPVDNVGVGNRDIVFTEDVGVSRGIFTGALNSRFGPFLQRSLSAGGPAEPLITINGAQFLSDGVATEFVTGSPFGTNYLEVCGVRADGSDIILGDQGPNGTCARTDQFSLMGRLHDMVASPIPSPLEIYNTFYRRDGAGTQVDLYARNIKALPSQPNPSLTAAAANIAPVKLIPYGPASLGEYYTQGLVDPAGNLPGPVSVINSADTPPSIVTKRAVDAVTVSSANYDYATDTLTVVATSSDKGFAAAGQLPPTLSIEGHSGTAASTGNTSDPAEVTLTAANIGGLPSDTVTVDSTGGGTGTIIIARNQMAAGTVGAPAPGVPLALDDAAAAEAGGAPVVIPVTANDVAAGPITSVQLVGLGIPAGSGSAAVTGTDITYTPGLANGDVTFQYTVSSAIGQSNVASVIVTVAPNAAGPAPITNPDGPVVAPVNQSVVINVLANDNGNGGTLNPGSVTVSNVTGGTATADASGNVTFTAGAAAGTFGFDYTVANDNGQVSQSAHATVTVVNPETITIPNGGAQCKAINATSGEWVINGTSSVTINNTIVAYAANPVPASPTAAQTVGSAVVGANGAFQIKAKPGPACVSLMSFKSSLNTQKINQAVSIK